MRISVITPSYKQPDWLRLCAASVADQSASNLEIEHIVHDNRSGPEIAQALNPFPEVKLTSENDRGMYDAINRGWKEATGDIFCWLNCDEQYLPGALQEVACYFRDHPEVDILFADTIITDSEGKYTCSRQVLLPELYHTYTSHLQTFSCATFFRRQLFHQRGFWLDSKWRALGDSELMIRFLRARVRMGLVPRYFSTFIDHGENWSLQPLSREEGRTLRAQAPDWAQKCAPIWVLLHRLRRWTHGLYQVAPFAYDIFTQASPRQRVHFEVDKPTFYWRARMH
jgi:glycosyltransferase involved in cell wall biosynthesis